MKQTGNRVSEQGANGVNSVGRLRHLKNISQYLMYRDEFKNFSYLVFSKGINVIIPILVTPYLIKMLGVENYGKIILMQTINIFFSVICTYGFDLSSIRDIATQSNNQVKLNFVVTEAYMVRFFLFLLFLPVFFLIEIYFFSYGTELFFIFSSFSLTLGTIFFPDWFFQAVKEMKYVAIMNIISKILFIILIFLFVKKSNDYIFPNLFLGISNLIVCFSGFIVIIKRFKFRRAKYQFSNLVGAIKNNRHLAMATFSTSIYSYINIIVMAMFTSPYSVGLYGIVDKIAGIFKILIATFGQMIFPKFCEIMSEISLSRAVNYYKRAVGIFAIPFFSLCIIVAIAALKIKIFFNVSNVNFIPALRLFLISVCLEFLINPFGYILVAQNKNKQFLKIISLSGLLSILLASVLSLYFDIFGVIWSTIMIQLMLLIIYVRLNFYKHA